MVGEFESMTAMHQIVPTFVPSPIAWGTFKSNQDLHFFLSEFHEMDLDLPEVKKFTARLAELHRKSSSPTGKYGCESAFSHEDLTIADGIQVFGGHGVRDASAPELTFVSSY